MQDLKFSSLLKVLVFIIVTTNIGFTFSACAQKAVINVLTYNIRLAIPGDAPNTWEHRKQNVFQVIREANPGILGVQEALKEQVSDLEAAFPGYTKTGVGRDDGKEAGEFSPLFFDTTKYVLIKSGTFWLSQTPLVAGSRGWDAACNRVVTWIQLKEKKSKTVFFVFCTHFDHLGEMARRNSATLLLHAVDSLSGNKPVIVLGDFNSVPGSEPYDLITEKSNPQHLTDARLDCKHPSGPEFTFTGFKPGPQPGVRIDYIFLKNNVQVLSFNVNEANDGQYYPSDHLPVSATLKIF